MNPTSLFASQISDDDRESIVRQLQVQRIQQFWHLLRSCNIQAEGSPVDFSSMQPFIQAVFRLCEHDPERGSGFLNQWPITFYTSRLLHHGLDVTSTANRLLPSLLFESLPDGSSPLANTSFVTELEDGTLPVPSRNGVLVVRRTQQVGPLIWRCFASYATAKDPLGNTIVGPTTLPLSDVSSSDELAFRPYQKSKCWDRPVVAEGRRFLQISLENANLGKMDDVSDTRSKALALTDSLDAAHGILKRTWPEIIDWISCLVPLFLDLTNDCDAGTRQSGSFGPGAPIYLTRITDPYLHAEDLVHELQHQRFYLAIPADEWFGKWQDSRQIYTSPYRRDPRPLYGLHLGLHAFVAVNQFRLRHHHKVTMRRDEMRQFAKTHFQNEFALKTIILNEELKKEGKLFYREIVDAIMEHASALRSFESPGLDDDALQSLRNHIASVGSTQNSQLNLGELRGADLSQMRADLL